MENLRCLWFSSWIGGDAARSLRPSADLRCTNAAFAAEGAKNSDADGLRGICSLALESGGPLLGGSLAKKLCRLMSASLDATPRRNKPGMSGIVLT